ncbi:MAG TPA: hypothetical protein VGV07_21795 [Devosia sp.]|jgi:hypothetical protein|uniref:hypothetical protein n=1 Tax=Devosia sp. TaxID=1871048 RepID=UPI002DDD71F1|nr:hypothetical protein [Devosia sp.]HEV2517900.1 hypothetical protein [Devosia sp.]
MSWTDLLFQGSNGLVRTAVVGLPAYVLSRVAGERTLVKVLSAPLGPVGDRS